MSRKRRREAASFHRTSPAAPAASRWWLALSLVYAVAVVWRVLFLGRIASGALAGHLQGDEHVYWDWSTSLIEHGFHAHNPFFLGPLYPYALALLRVVTGGGVERVVLVQSLLGGLTAVLVADAARRLARPGIALFVGLVVALYGMLVLFDAVILMESLLLFLGALLLWLVARVPVSGPHARTSAALGVAIGLAAECRASMALLLVPVLAFVFEPEGGDRGPRRMHATLVVAAFVVVSLPSAISNALTTHALIPYTYNLGYNLAVGNHPGATGGYVSITQGSVEAAVPAGAADGGVQLDGREYLRKRRGLELSPAQSSAYWQAEALRFVREHPVQVLKLLGAKALLLVHHSEVSQIESAEMYRHLAGPLGFPLLGSFLFLGPLGLAGALFARQAGRYARFVRGVLLMVALGVLPFFVTDRYRVHLVPPLALLAALALERAWGWWRARSWGELRHASMLAAAALALTLLPIRGDAARLAEWTNWEDVGARWAEHGEHGRAIAAFEQALRLQRGVGHDRDSTPVIVEARALLAFNYAVALHQAGRDGDALRWFAAAGRDDPDNARFVRTLADAYGAAGRAREADSLAAKLRTLVGGEPQALIQEGWQAMREARPAAAESLFTLATKLDENQFGAWMALVRVQVERDELPAAQRTLDRAGELRVPEDMLWAHRALVAAASGDSARAHAALAHISPGSIAGNRLLETVVDDAQRRLGRDPR